MIASVTRSPVNSKVTATSTPYSDSGTASGASEATEFRPMPAALVGNDFHEPLVGRSVAAADIDGDGLEDVMHSFLNGEKDVLVSTTIIESGLANTSPLTGISVQSALPLLLRGSKAAMTTWSENYVGLPMEWD